MRKPKRALRPLAERLDGRCLLSGYAPADLVQAYGLGGISFTSPSGQPVIADGSGQTVALIEAYHDPNLVSDLQTFDQTFGLPAASVTVDDLAGPRTSDVWASEEMLDVEWAHAIAPGANLLVVEAASQNLGDLIHAVDVARYAPGVSVVSMSWGFPETIGQTVFDSYFQTPSGHQGVTFVAASGDNGTAAGPSYPSTSPGVLAVGGTTLSIGPGGSYLGESAWSGSGGGYSLYEPEPSFQYRVQSTGFRSAPDVAFLGDPNTGVNVFETPPSAAPNSGAGSWMIVGGTSLGTPAWAAILAIVDQGRVLEGKGSLDGPTQTLPALYSLPSTDFHAIQATPPLLPLSGGLSLFGLQPTSRASARHPGHRRVGATSSANITTGLGSPVGTSLIPDLVASNVTAPSTYPNAPRHRDRRDLRTLHRRLRIHATRLVHPGLPAFRFDSAGEVFAAKPETQTIVGIDPRMKAR